MVSLWLLEQCCGTYVAMLHLNVIEKFPRVARKGKPLYGKCEWEEEVHATQKITKQTMNRIYWNFFYYISILFFETIN